MNTGPVLFVYYQIIDQSLSLIEGSNGMSEEQVEPEQGEEDKWGLDMSEAVKVSNILKLMYTNFHMENVFIALPLKWCKVIRS